MDSIDWQALAADPSAIDEFEKAARRAWTPGPENPLHDIAKAFVAEVAFYAETISRSVERPAGITRDQMSILITREIGIRISQSFLAMQPWSTDADRELYTKVLFSGAEVVREQLDETTASLKAGKRT